MTQKDNAPEQVEQWLIANRDAKAASPDVLNLPTLEERCGLDYQTRKASLQYADYLLYAEQHYAIARILCQSRVWVYGFFCAQQAVETYLKAYLKMHGSEPKNTHDLSKLLQTCRALKRGDDFIDGAHIEIVVSMFDAYNEVGRYPVHKRGPAGTMGATFPHDLYAMDYFVYKLRELVPTPANHSSLFSNTHVFLSRMQHLQPETYRLITADNINFGG